MKKLIFAIILSACLGAVTQNIWAQVMLVQPVDVVLQKLKNQGFIAVWKIQLVADEYQVHALDKDGEPVDLRINSHSGELLEMKKTDAHISMLDIVEKIEGVGYSGITLIEIKNSHYNVIARDPAGKTVKLRVDAATGNITKKLF